MHRLNHLYLIRQYAIMLIVCFLASLLFALGASDSLYDLDGTLSIFLWISAMWWLMTSPQESLKSNWFLATLPLERKQIHRSRYYCSMICIGLMLGAFITLSLITAILGISTLVDMTWVMSRVFFSLAIFSLIFAVTLSSDNALLRVIITLAGGIVTMLVQQHVVDKHLAAVLVCTLLAAMISVLILRYGEKRFVQMDLV